MTFQVATTGFKEGQAIPKGFTEDGRNLSPPLRWRGLPNGTNSLALICDDPDAPVGVWVHWVIYDIPATVTSLPEGVPPQERIENGARQGTNSWGSCGYGGPSPPPGKAHRYFFKLYALDKLLHLPPLVKKEQLLAAMKGHILAESKLMGTYSR